MAPSRFQRTSAVFLAASLVASSTAFDFTGQNNVSQTAGTVAPQQEQLTQGGATTGASGFGSPVQWSSSNNVPTMAPSTPSTDTGNQEWGTTGPTTSTGWTPPSSSGAGDQTWNEPTTSGTGSQGWPPLPTQSTASSSFGAPPSTGGNQDWGSLECESDEGSAASTPGTGGYSLECSGSDDTSTPTTGYSLECSGSNDVETPAAPSTASSGTEQGAVETPSPASSSNTATSTFEDPAPSTPSTLSTASSGTTDQGSSQAQTPSTPSTTSSSNTATSTTSSGTGQQQGGSDSTSQTSNSTSSGDHATFGDVTSASGECVIGNPNAYVSANYIDWVWDNRIGPNADTSKDSNWNVMTNKNWIMDHIVHNKGSLNYCVRWDSTEKLSKTVASKFQAMVERQYAAWNHWLIGYDCWPYNEIKVNIVGFAVKEKSLLDWTDDSLGTIYEGDLDSDGVPQCSQSCYRFFDNGPGSWTDTSSCKGEPFDISLWPKQGLEGGFGYDWGQEVNLENMLQTIDQEQLVIVAHEIGHGFGLPDFYETTDKPAEDWPNCIMMAGSSMEVTPSDGWMLRRVLEHVKKDRYSF